MSKLSFFLSSLVMAVAIPSAHADAIQLTREIMYDAAPDASVPADFHPIPVADAQAQLYNEMKSACGGKDPGQFSWANRVENAMSYGRQRFFVRGAFQCAVISSIQGEEAGLLFSLLQESGHQAGILRVGGYVTERANPPIAYDVSSLEISSGKRLPLSGHHETLQPIVNLLEKSGIPAAINSGGTTYITYTAKVDCVSRTLCTIQKAN